MITHVSPTGSSQQPSKANVILEAGFSPADRISPVSSLKIGSCFRGDLQAKCWDSSISGLLLGLEMALGTVTFERIWPLGLSFSVGLETYKVFQETYGLRPRPPVLLSKQRLGTRLPAQDPLNSHAQGHSVYSDALVVPYTMPGGRGSQDPPSV